MTAKLVVVGRFAGVYATQGWLKVQSYTDPPKNILSYKPWQIVFPNNKQEEITLAHQKVHGDKIVVQLTGYDDRDIVKRFCNADIAIFHHQLPPLPADECYWVDLEGMRVIDQNNHELGTVSQVLATGANEVLVVEGHKRTLIPYLLGQVILSVDKVTQTITVNWDPDF